MKIESNTDRFLALKKLSELKEEHHKRNLMSLIPLRGEYKESKNKVRTYVQVAQTLFSLFQQIRQNRS